MLSPDEIDSLKDKAFSIRRDILDMVYRAQSGHIGGSLGASDLLVALYYRLMRHDPSNPTWTARDRFVLSKGHCTPVIYAVLADCGYFPKEDLLTFRRPGSHLQGHPYEPKTPGIDASTGTLGLGISTAAGMALAAKFRRQAHRIFVVCGDGEIQEGQAWEAAMFASKYRLDNLIAFVDRNGLQTDGCTEDIMPLDPLAPKWIAFGWWVAEIDGHDFGQICSAVDAAAKQGKPAMIIARTTKGKGVGFMENDNKWHGAPPSAAEYERAVKELSRGM